MLKRHRSLLSAALLVALPAVLNAQMVERPARQPAPPRNTGMGVVLEGGFEFGGDQILEITFTNGDVQKIYAGQGGSFAAGVSYRPVAMPKLSIAGTIGYKFVTTAADNANITFTRIPVELTARYAVDGDWYIGGGLVSHNSIHLNGDGWVPDADLDPATGGKLELGWRWVAATYTVIDYIDPNGDTRSGNAIGIKFRWVSGRH